MAERFVPRFCSVTSVTFRRSWHVVAAARRWRRLTAELAGAGYRLESGYQASWRRRRVTFLTLAPDEETLRAAAATDTHVEAVRWTIPRRTRLWSGVYALSGWSSMSGPPEGNWAYRSGQ